MVNPDQVVAPAVGKLMLCAHCGALGAVDPGTGMQMKIKKCPCLLVAYCSTACQKAAWKGHKAACLVERARRKKVKV